MILFPAIDIMNGRAVRLKRGERATVTDYGLPCDMAMRWVDEGAEYLHIVDLDSAFDGTSSNGRFIEDIVKRVGVPVQVGGGVRSLKRAEELFDCGAARVIIGTDACENPDTIGSFTEKYGNRIACGIDEKNGYAAIKGWTEQSSYRSAELALLMKSKGVDTVIYTDISRDGALFGVNAAATSKLAAATGMNIIASGGVSGIEDVRALIGCGNVYGVILGKALYEGRLSLKEAIELVKNA